MKLYLRNKQFNTLIKLIELTVPYKAAYTLLAKNEETFDRDLLDKAKQIWGELLENPNIDRESLYRTLKQIDFFAKYSDKLELE